MKQFYFDRNSLEFAVTRECKKCPHRCNSLLASEGCEVNPFERYAVYYSWMSEVKYYPDINVARDALRLLCNFDYIYRKNKQNRRPLTLKEKLCLSLRYNFEYKEDKCFCNGKLYAEIREV